LSLKFSSFSATVFLKKQKSPGYNPGSGGRKNKIRRIFKENIIRKRKKGEAGLLSPGQRNF